MINQIAAQFSATPVPVTQFNMFIEGMAYGGKIEDLTLPKLAIKTDDVRAGGLDGVLVTDMGLEKLEFEATLLDYDPFVLASFGFGLGGGPNINIRGAMKRPGLPAAPLSVKLQGMITEIDFGNWKAAEKKTMKFKMVCEYYALSMGGVDLIEINVRTGLRMIAGVPQNADVKAALGTLI